MPLNICEALNWTLKEQFICATPLSIEELTARFQSAPPRPIAHWNCYGHDIVWTEIENKLRDHDARAFARSYARTMLDSGWKIITED